MSSPQTHWSPQEDAVRQPMEEALGRLQDLSAGQALERLCSTLEDLGPLTAAAGAYLGSRPDVVDAQVAQELLRCQGRWGPEDSEDARQSLQEALEGRPSLLVDLSSPQLWAGGLRARFLARTAAGQRLHVEVIPTALQRRSLAQAEHLELLAETLIQRGWATARVDEALADFRTLLIGRFDLEAAAVQATADGLETVSELCGSRLLAYGEIQGTSFKEILAEESRPSNPERDRMRSLALSLARAWLRPILSGATFRQTLDEEAIVVLEGSEAWILGGLTQTSSSPLAASLKDYLIAVAAEDTDDAWKALAPWFEGEAPASGEPLRLRLRQAVAFRDTQFSGREDLTELLLVHWRLVTASGLRARPPLLAFFRGLVQVRALGNRLAPEEDPVLDAIGSLKTEESLRLLQNQISGPALSRSLEHQADFWLHVPQHLDHLLGALDRDGEIFRLRAQEAPEEGRRKDRRALRGATGLALLAATALAQTFLPTAGWAQGLAALLLLTFGSFLLKEIYRAH